MIEQKISFDLIKKFIPVIQIKMNTPEFINLKKNNMQEYTSRMIKEFPKFNEEFPFIFKKIISGDDLSMLDIFFNKLSEVDSGQNTINNVRQELGHLLNDIYVKK